MFNLPKSNLHNSCIKFPFLSPPKMYIDPNAAMAVCPCNSPGLLLVLILCHCRVAVGIQDLNSILNQITFTSHQNPISKSLIDSAGPSFHHKPTCNRYE